MQEMSLCVQGHRGMRAGVYYPDGGPEPARKALLTRNVRAGESIFENEPFACVLSANSRASRCSLCFCHGQTLLMCSRCKFANYCSKACQLMDWEAGHKQECKQAKALVDEGCAAAPLDEILLMVRTYGKTHVTNTSTSSTCACNAGGSVRCGTLHVLDMCVGGDFDELGVQTLSEGIRRVAAAYTTPQQDLLRPLSRLFASFRANNFAILSPLFDPIGAGIYAFTAILNHSCTPNVLLTYLLQPGRAPILRGIALKDLRVGDELFHCYIDSSLHTSARRASLMSSYSFLCQCPRCSLPLPSEAASASAPAAPKIADGKVVEAEDRIEILYQSICTNASDPLALHAIISSASELELNALQPRIDGMQEAHVDAPVIDAIKACTALREAFNASVNLPGESAEQLAIIDSMDKALAGLSAALGHFNAPLYRLKCGLFSDVLLAALQSSSQPQTQFAAKLCRQICSYLVVTLRSFPFHPLLGLQMVTLGQLDSDAAVLDWSCNILRKCNAGDDGCMQDVLLEAEEALRQLRLQRP